MKIEDLKIDKRIRSLLIDQGIRELYPPQAEAVNKGLMDSKNLVVAIPTASGKTLIAILGMIAQLSKNRHSKAVYLAPLRALASEKFHEIKEFADQLGFKVGISTGDLDENNNWMGRYDIIIATNEKFDSIIRHQASWLDQISCVVSDEVHLINDHSRGPVLEVVLSQIKEQLPQCQIIALSATIKNADEISEWLGAELVLSTWRPVILKEGVYFDGKTTFNDKSVVPVDVQNKRNPYVDLAIQSVEQGGQTLVFCNSRKTVMSSASTIARSYKKKLSGAELKELERIADSILAAGERTTLSSDLAAVVKSGVGFHHAGLNNKHRSIIENAFKQRKLKIITASPTLAAGVNLPGRRVIIRQLTRYESGIGSYYIPVLEYKQMAGRAGRPRYDEFGESILLAKNNGEFDMLFDRYIHADTEVIFSKFGSEPSLRAHLLSFIVNGYVTDFESAISMIRTTFFGHQNQDQLFFIEDTVFTVLEVLGEGKLISKEEPYIATPFGERVSQLYLDPLTAVKIKNGLERSHDRDDLRPLAYFLLIVGTPDAFSFYVRESESGILIDAAEKNFDQNIGQDPGSEVDFEFFMQYLKTALVLEMWLEEKPEEEIYKLFNVASGDIHSLISTAEWLLNASLQISKIFKWDKHREKLERLVMRIKYGIQEELIELSSIPNIGRRRARILYDAGFTTKASITRAKLSELQKLIGEKTALNLVNSLDGGQEFTAVSEETEKKGQQTLDDFF